MTSILRSSQLRYRYPSGNELKFPDFSCKTGDHLLISGNSGAGKTTLLHLMGGLISILEGEVWVSGVPLSSLSSQELDRFRGRNIGFVFQQPSFIQSLSVLENIQAAQYFGIGGVDTKEAIRLLNELGIERYRNKKTNELSGGERQRLSIARALSIAPAIILADEPTSSLDNTNAHKVYDLLKSEAEDNNATLIVVTHDDRLKSKFENRVEL